MYAKVYHDNIAVHGPSGQPLLTLGILSPLWDSAAGVAVRHDSRGLCSSVLKDGNQLEDHLLSCMKKEFFSMWVFVLCLSAFL